MTDDSSAAQEQSLDAPGETALWSPTLMMLSPTQHLTSGSFRPTCHSGPQGAHWYQREDTPSCLKTPMCGGGRREGSRGIRNSE